MRHLVITLTVVANDGKKAVIRATLNIIIDSINVIYFGCQQVKTFVLKANSTCFMLQRHELVQWDKCPGVCTCPTLVATCPRQTLMSSPACDYLY